MISTFSANPVIGTVQRQLEDWLAEGKIRAVDLQLARQVCLWEQEADEPATAQQDNGLAALMLVSCALSMALGRGQVCLCSTSKGARPSGISSSPVRSSATPTA